MILKPVLLPSQNDVKTLKKWMSDVDVFLNEEWPALGDSEALEKQLEQCTVRKLPTTSPKRSSVELEKETLLKCSEEGLFIKTLY